MSKKIQSIPISTDPPHRQKNSELLADELRLIAQGHQWSSFIYECANRLAANSIRIDMIRRIQYWRGFVHGFVLMFGLFLLMGACGIMR